MGNIIQFTPLLCIWTEKKRCFQKNTQKWGSSTRHKKKTKPAASGNLIQDLTEASFKYTFEIV